MDRMTLLYSLLKITSMIATGLFGALGLLSEYKNDQGKITKWGKIALGGIIISSFISLGLYIIETSQAKSAAKKAQTDAEATSQKLETILLKAQLASEQQKKSLKETEILKSGLEKTLKRSNDIAKGMEKSLAAQREVLTGNRNIMAGVSDTVIISKQAALRSETAANTAYATLSDVRRTLNRIGDFQVEYQFDWPLDHPLFRDYVHRIDVALDTIIATMRPDIGATLGDHISLFTKSDAGKTIDEFVYIHPGSSLMPAIPDAPDVRKKLRSRNYLVGIYEGTIDFSKWTWYQNQYEVKMSFIIRGITEVQDPSKAILSTGRLDLIVNRPNKLMSQQITKSLPADLHRAPDFSSWLDLEGKTLVLQAPGGDDKSCIIQKFAILLPDGGRIEIKGSKFQRIDIPSKIERDSYSTLWVYQFPKEDDS